MRIHPIVLVAFTALFLTTMSVPPKVVLRSDHFASEQQTSINYLLTTVKKGKPLVLILKTADDHNMDLISNPILATIQSASRRKQCTFSSRSKMCILETVEKSKFMMTLQCRSAPCYISWELFQPELNSQTANGSKQVGHGLYTLQNFSAHVITRIFCNDPSLKDFGKDVQIYSQNDFERGGTLQEIYVMFSNKDKGYIYVDIAEESQACAVVKFNNVPQSLPYSDEPVIDFTSQQSPSVFTLQAPQYDIHLDCLFHMLHSGTHLDKKIPPVNITLSGQQGDSFQVVQYFYLEPTANKEQMVFSLTFKNTGKQYKQLKLETTTQSNFTIIVDFLLTDTSVQSITLGEESYYKLAKQETIRYIFPPVQDGSDKQIIQILVSKPTEATISTARCSLKEGCQFTLTALEDTQGFVVVESRQNTEGSIEFLPIVKAFKKKGKLLENIYLKKMVEKNKSFRVNINTPNAIMYASSPQKCAIPSDQCQQKTGNIHHPILYTPSRDGEFLLNVVLLQNCEFVITIVEESDEYISLEDGSPFSYTLYEKEQRLEFKYTMQTHKQVNFNLIAPLNTLLLTVENSPEGGRQISTEGFLTFIKEQIKQKQFTITIEKNPGNKNKQIHFTLLVSTEDTVIQLQPTVPHYETIKPEAYREYVFQFISSEEYIINFYTHNILNHKIKVMFALSTDRSWNTSNLEKKWIDRESDYIDLNSQANHLCKTEGLESCEIFLRLQNQMEIEIDITITLLTRNFVIELKDGIWQSYSESTVIKSAHFYFYPKHSDKNVVLIYRSTTDSLKLAYNLWKTDSHTINPLYWPFPMEPASSQISSLRSVHQIVIDKEVLQKQCAPYCVVLITLYQDFSRQESRWGQGKSIKIMASNNQIELPQKTRLQMTLKTGEEKDLVVDLKYALVQEQITFYNTRLFGNYIIFADLYSEKKNRCPLDGKETSDYVLESGQNTFDIEDIRKRMRQLGIDKDASIYMCLSIRTQTDSKFSVEYSTSKQKIKHVHLDSFEEVILAERQSKFYQVEGYYDFTVKIMRKSGFPYVYIKECPAPQLNDCKQQVLTEKNHGQQLVTKTQFFQKAPCKDCVYIFRFTSQEAASVILHLKSKYSMIELKQHEIMTDFMQIAEENNYMWTHVTARPMILDIHVMTGSLKANLTNGKGQHITKTSSADNKLLHFYIDPQKPSNEIKRAINENNSLINSYQFSNTFKNYILMLSNEETDRSCIYNLVYSSGQSQIYLQDGLITDLALQPGKPRTFFYIKESKHPIYLTLSAENASLFQSLVITSSYFDANETQNKIEFLMEKPKMNREAPSPILVFQLPQKTRFEIVLNNDRNESFPISIGINHQEIMFLPLGHEYPFAIHQSENIHFVVELSHPGFLQVAIRKCDKTQPTFAYTDEYSDFSKGQFDSEKILSEGPLFKEIIKVNKADSFYLSFWGSQFEQTHLSIALSFHQTFPSHTSLRAGGNGLIEYEILQNKRAQITFIPVRCKKANCPKHIRYYIMTSVNQDQLQAKMVCPSAYFLAHEEKDSFSEKEIEVTEEQTIVDTVYDLRQHIQYLGVKAVTDQGEQIYYKSIQIATFWGQLSRTSHSHKITLAALLCLSVCALLWFVRYNARRGYRKIEQEAPPHSEEGDPPSQEQVATDRQQQIPPQSD